MGSFSLFDFDRFDVPEDGFPSIEDWNLTFSSVLLDGLELTREPLDVSIPDFKPDSFLSAFVQLSSLQPSSNLPCACCSIIIVVLVLQHS